MGTGTGPTFDWGLVVTRSQLMTPTVGQASVTPCVKCATVR